MQRLRFCKVFFGTLFTCLVVTNGFTEDVDLRPTAWPPGDLEYYASLQNSNQRSHPPAEGFFKGMVVGSQQALAMRAGVEALRQGGSALDAVLTTALAQITLSGGGPVSFAGILTLVYYEADSGEVYLLNGGWDIPQGQASGNDIPTCSNTPDGRQVARQWVVDLHLR